MRKFSVIVKNKNDDEKMNFDFLNLENAYKFADFVINTSEYFTSIIEIEIS